jgi:hypothetical protein
MSDRALTISSYAAVALVVVVLYVAGRARRLGLVPFGDVVDALRSLRAGRLALAIGWVWLGWHFLGR